jgi:MucR family transcriptional regulator, transcriptional regulator of exopolysaccharide biosynthesis
VNTEDTAKRVDLRLLTKIIASYLSSHKVEPDQLSALIASVERTLGGLGKTPPTPPLRSPAVPIRRSVQHDHVVCLDCGFKGKTLRRHLKTRHNLEPAEYLARWGLPPDHPLTAPAYSEQRSAMAKRIGLGMRRQGRRQRRRQAEA